LLLEISPFIVLFRVLGTDGDKQTTSIISPSFMPAIGEITRFIRGGFDANKTALFFHFLHFFAISLEVKK
jgi:hypothetical protein